MSSSIRAWNGRLGRLSASFRLDIIEVDKGHFGEEVQRELIESTNRRRIVAGFGVRIENKQRRGKDVICVVWAILLPNPALFSPPRILWPCAQTPLVHPAPSIVHPWPPLLDPTTPSLHEPRPLIPHARARPGAAAAHWSLSSNPASAHAQRSLRPAIKSRQLLWPGHRAEAPQRMAGTAPSTMPTQKFDGRLEATSPDRRPRGVHVGAVRQTRKACCRSQPSRRS